MPAMVRGTPLRCRGPIGQCYLGWCAAKASTIHNDGFVAFGDTGATSELLVRIDLHR